MTSWFGKRAGGRRVSSGIGRGNGTEVEVEAGRSRRLTRRREREGGSEGSKWGSAAPERFVGPRPFGEVEDASEFWGAEHVQACSRSLGEGETKVHSESETAAGFPESGRWTMDLHRNAVPGCLPARPAAGSRSSTDSVTREFRMRLDGNVLASKLELARSKIWTTTEREHSACKTDLRASSARARFHNNLVVLKQYERAAQETVVWGTSSQLKQGLEPGELAGNQRRPSSVWSQFCSMRYPLLHLRHLSRLPMDPASSGLQPKSHPSWRPPALYPFGLPFRLALSILSILLELLTRVIRSPP